MVKPSRVSAPQPLAVGWYGKLPSRGDFMGRGLPRPWLRTWDEWLQRALSAATQRVGANLLHERLLAMTPWQCIVLPTQDGQPTWHGVVGASADRVGRVFPLLLAEAYGAAELDAVALPCLRERALQMGAWLRDAAATRPPREFELGVTPWATTAWPDAAGSGSPTLGEWRRAAPTAGSFWWRLDAASRDTQAISEAVAGPIAEAWPPSEGLLLEWLAVTD